MTFASSEAIGLSSIASLVHPVGRDEDHGLGVQMDPDATQKVMAPIAPACSLNLELKDGTNFNLEAAGPNHRPRGDCARWRKRN